MLKFPNINIGKILLLVTVLTWLGLLFVDLLRLFGTVNRMNLGIAHEITWTLEIIFFILVYLFYTRSIDRNEQNNFIQLIWRAASTGLMVIGAAFLIRIFYIVLDDTRLSTDPLLANFFYHVNFGLTSLFLISCALLWKKLILYQKNKNTVQQWQIYEVMLFVSMFYVYFNQNTFDFTFLFGLVFLIIFGVIISVNLKWIPYLTFKDKWKSILFFAIILITTSFLFMQSMSYQSHNAEINLMDNLFLIGLFGFVFIYSLFSFLVTLFNLPTSSVFEQKLTEAINFQKLSQSIQPGQSETQVLDILVDSCMSAAYADASWLEIVDEENQLQILHQRFITNKDRKEVKELMNKYKTFSTFLNQRSPTTIDHINSPVEHDLYKSALIVPIWVNKHLLGYIFLLKEVKNGFNKEMLNIVTTFVGQASISVENHRLLNEAIKNERYKEELKIAQRVQRSLLPSDLHHNEHFDIFGFSEAADEVGGDYYETYQFDENRFALIIGDVSGKGLSAAFNMSQMKGVFHSLVQLDLPPKEFLAKANNALSSCLAKNLFITTTYYLIDTSKSSITFCRAGHCPTLYYDNAKDQTDYITLEGLGLGILRNDKYPSYLHEKTIHYHSGDILVMYTDGIVESKNQNGEEYGYDRLKEALDTYKEESPETLKNRIISSVYEFVGEAALPDDDYSLMVLKFL
ncbi:serine/threonine-protein phosphatase [Echinicola strongylocentroti]|uniref:Serine/threonine-protein phosphatase n=1 Tax=Echinicola strongylocentroti TaxID=1795355 RepID=A0A2Z4IIJ2_9BACT|nr:GAF domain-containing SpoIIE family protein phosphatase [Echinicola strongylocentroti]AWW30338.1 serine/threonine-protein phosphatase [Echinicola strongylocentroti]